MPSWSVWQMVAPISTPEVSLAMRFVCRKVARGRCYLVRIAGLLFLVVDILVEYIQQSCHGSFIVT